jgi:hypothetical protein
MLWFWCGVLIGWTIAVLAWRRTGPSAPIRAAAMNRVLRLIESDPDNWRLSRHAAWHLSTGICIGRAEDEADLTVNGISPPMSLRRRLVRALRDLRDRQLAATIDRAIARYAAPVD